MTGRFEISHQGQDRIVALATMDSATATVAALPAEGSTSCHLPAPHHPHAVTILLAQFAVRLRFVDMREREHYRVR